MRLGGGGKRKSHLLNEGYDLLFFFSQFLFQSYFLGLRLLQGGSPVLRFAIKSLPQVGDLLFGFLALFLHFSHSVIAILLFDLQCRNL